jgi:hypothetical protein
VSCRGPVQPRKAGSLFGFVQPAARRAAQGDQFSAQRAALFSYPRHYISNARFLKTFLFSSDSIKNRKTGR